MIKKPLRGASATIYDLDTDGKAHVKTTWTIKSLVKETKILTIKQEAVVTTKEIRNPKGYDERDYHFEPELQVGPRMTIIRYSLTKTIDPGESYSFTIEYDFGGYVRKIGNKWVFEDFRALIGPFADLFEAVDYTVIMKLPKFKEKKLWHDYKIDCSESAQKTTENGRVMIRWERTLRPADEFSVYGMYYLETYTWLIRIGLAIIAAFAGAIVEVLTKSLTLFFTMT